MPGRPLPLHKPRCPHFLHTSCNGHISAYQVKNPCHLPLFCYVIQSCHYLLLSINSSLSMPYISSESTSHPPPLHALSHSVHFLSSLLKPLHLLTFTCSSAVPPPHLASSVFSHLLSPHSYTSSFKPSFINNSFNTHSFDRSTNSSNHIMITSLHAQFFSIYFTSAFDMPFTLSNLTSPHPKTNSPATSLSH